MFWFQKNSYFCKLFLKLNLGHKWKNNLKAKE